MNLGVSMSLFAEASKRILLACFANLWDLACWGVYSQRGSGQMEGNSQTF